MDFEGTSPQVKASLNSTLSFTKSNAYAAMRTLLRSDIPNNAGFFRPITVTAPLGSIVNCVLPAATGTRGLTGFRVMDAVFGALAQALPDRVMGASDGGLSLVTIAGQRPGGDRFSVVELVSGAWGGQADHEGQDGVPEPRRQRQQHPGRDARGGRPGAGRSVRLRRRHRGRRASIGGGLSLEREYTFLGERILSVRADRETILPYGIGAGAARDAVVQRARRRRRGARRCRPSSRAGSSPATGSPIGPRAPAAGAIRSRAIRRRSRPMSATASCRAERARAAYGVIVGADATLDGDATAAERQARGPGRAAPSSAAAPTPLADRTPLT